MFEDFFQKSKTRFENAVKEILDGLRQDYEKFWQEMIAELTKKKLELEQQIKKSSAEKELKEKRVLDLSQEIVKLSEAGKKEEEKLKKYEFQQRQILDKIIEIEAKEKESQKLAEILKQREIEIMKKEDAIKLEVALFEERQRELKQIWEKVHPTS